MTKKWILLGLWAVLSAILPVQGQTTRIQGRVLDAVSGDPLQGATITILNTNRGTISDVQGRFLSSLLQAPTALLYLSVISAIASRLRKFPMLRFPLRWRLSFRKTLSIWVKS